MAQLADLITEDANMLLKHPIVGLVAWAEVGGSGTGRILSFAKGPEVGQPLVADAAVILDDRWEIACTV